MARELDRIPNFDEIVFEIRNKDYGAYLLRKKYNRNVIVALLIGVSVISTAVITPYYNARAMDNRQKHTERLVEIKMQNINNPDQTIAPPPPPPPPPPSVVQQAQYIPPVVVDSLETGETTQLMTAVEAQVEVKDLKAVEIVKDVKIEDPVTETEPEPFIRVEEMPLFPGGESGLLQYIAANTVYPDLARENNIQGKVFVRFCVTSKGGVDLVSIAKSVDTELDAEAIRVVKTLPLFKPGKQGGKPVPVWYAVPINFQIKQE